MEYKMDLKRNFAAIIKRKHNIYRIILLIFVQNNDMSILYIFNRLTMLSSLFQAPVYEIQNNTLVLSICTV